MIKLMKRNCLLMLCLLLLETTIFPPQMVVAQEENQRSVYDAISLLYFSDAILGGYTDLETASTTHSLMSPPTSSLRDDPDNASLAAALQAAKEERNDLEANCSLMTSRLRAEGKDCEADRVQAACEAKKQEINAEIGRLHDLRGDRRRLPTKIWHFLKRQGRGFWHRIGPIGRNFLRQTGPEVLQVVVTGGALNSGVLKTLLKQQARAMGRQRIQEIVYQGVERLLLGQLELAQEAGVDICAEEPDGNEQEPGSVQAGSEETATGSTANWNCTSDRGFYGAWMQAGDPNTKVDETELVFSLTADSSIVQYDLSFHGVAQLPLYSAEGDLYGYHQAEDIISGQGQAKWDGNYFYGAVTINRDDILYGSSADVEPVSYHDVFENKVIGGYSPDLNQIHLCFHEHTRKQFDSIKQQPFDQLLANCASNNYFVCNPK
jgi:hypothetical protein